MKETGRVASRFRVKGLRIVYDTGEEYWTAPVLNMSETGLFVETHHELSPGTRVTILPDTEDDDKLPFEITAEVVRVDEYDEDEHWDRTPGIGFRLVEMSEEQVEQVRAFLRDHGVARS